LRRDEGVVAIVEVKEGRATIAKQVGGAARCGDRQEIEGVV
jgi:hypothetical protein